MAETQQTITAEKLCALTGYTDRRHRQLASAGYFPPPTNSQYLLVPTIQGLFRHFRQKSESTEAKAKKLDADTKRAIEEAKLKRAQRMEMEGRMIPAELVDKRISDALLAIRQAILGIPQNACNGCNPSDPQLALNVLTRHIKAVWGQARENFTKGEPEKNEPTAST